MDNIPFWILAIMWAVENNIPVPEPIFTDDAWTYPSKGGYKMFTTDFYEFYLKWCNYES